MPTTQQLKAKRRQQKRVGTNPYYSKCRLTTSVSGGGGAVAVHTYTAGTQVLAFGYANGNDMAAAGRSGTIATFADTNLTAAGRTIGGQRLLVKGMAITICPNTECAEILIRAWTEMSTTLRMNGGETNIALGCPYFWPGAGALNGAQTTTTGAQPIAGGRPNYFFVSNGVPGIGNFGRIPEGVYWEAEGEQDSVLNIVHKIERAVSFTTQLADEAAAAGIRGYANPIGTNVFIEFMTILFGTVSNRRSRVM